MLGSIEETSRALQQAGYVGDEAIATAVFLARKLGKPLLVEGPAGVGKTQLSKTVAEILRVPLVRLQCYEGLDEAKALYEWNYGKQMLQTQSASSEPQDLFSRAFLMPRPLLQALESPQSVLLIDEVDRSDPEFEALLFEILSDWQVTVPELGTIKASEPPFVVLTSNATRDVTDALRRRCLYAWLDYPMPSREAMIIEKHVPEASSQLIEQITKMAHELRQLELQKVPSIAEVIEWTRALVVLGAEKLEKDLVSKTLQTIAKYQDDVKMIQETVIDRMDA